jgi:flagellar hook-associated protein 3 FlgL
MSRMSARGNALAMAQQRLDEIQQQLSTGRRIDRVSQDPSGGTLALEHRNTIGFESQMRRNLSSGLAFINASEAALDGVTESLQRMRELTVQAANDTLSTQERQNISIEVDQLTMHVVQMANTNFAGAYVFSGQKTDQPAYQVNYAIPGAPATSFVYQGDTGLRVRRVSLNDTAAVNIPGSTVFGNLFNDLMGLRNDLSVGAPAQQLQVSIGKIDAGLKGVVDARASLGARANRFEAAMAFSARTDVELQDLRSNLEDVDIPTAVTKFSGAQAALQAALGAIGRTSSMSLLDFLR